MNRGLLYKGFQEALLPTLVCGLGLAIFEGFVANLFYTYQEQLINDLAELPFLEELINALIGVSGEGGFGPGTLKALAWVHPLVLSILFAHEITICTRVPAGEIDRGTADVLFALPVTRWTVFRSETALWLGAGLVVLTLAVLGSAIGNSTIPADGRPDPAALARVLLNLSLLYTTVGSMALCLSAYSSSRGRAIGTSVGILVVLFLWNFLTQYSDFVDGTAFLNVLSYYKPLPMLNGEPLPLRDLAVLATTTLVLWTAAGWRLSHRDIATI